MLSCLPLLRKYVRSSDLIDMSLQHFSIYIQLKPAQRTAHPFKSFAAVEVAIATNQRRELLKTQSNEKSTNHAFR
jgi:hypothetical protein